MAFDWKSGIGGLAGIGSGLGGYFGGGKSPSDAANQYLNQIPGQTSQYFNPYIQGGQNQFNQLGEQATGLMNNPGGKLNDIGANFQQSPGFKFALEQALGGANRAAAAGGMAGSPANQQQDMQLANDIANQDYYNWLGQATGLYGQGLNAAQNEANLGLNAGTNQANNIATLLAQQGQNAFNQQSANNIRKGGAFSDILGGLGKFGGAFFGA